MWHYGRILLLATCLSLASLVPAWAQVQTPIPFDVKPGSNDPHG